MDFQKELDLKTGEENSISFDVFTGTNGYADEVKDVRIGRAFNLYCHVAEGITVPLRITIQRQVALELDGKRAYRDFGEPELIMVEYPEKVYGLNLTPVPLFDRLIVSCADGIGGDTVTVLLKIL